MNGKIIYASNQAWSAILKIQKPNIWLLHGHYPGGRNDPNNKKPA